MTLKQRPCNRLTGGPALALAPALAPVLALALAGCAVGPDFERPQAPVADRYGAEPTPAQTTATAVRGGEAQIFLAKPVDARWWTSFGSPKLDALVEQALTASPTLASAQAALRIAEENARARGGALLPSVDAAFNPSRQKIDTGSFGNPGGGGVIYSLFNASVNVSYGLDIWGGTRRNVEASQAAAEAAAYQLEATYQTLIANLVTSAVETAEQRALLLGQEMIVADQARLLTITERQYEIGSIGRSELLAAQSSIAAERAKLQPLRLALTRAQNQLAAYAGRLPSDPAASQFELSELSLPQAVPLSLPSELVRQRPDVLAAEAQLHEAAANVGVATANLLPQISLTASFGTQSSVFENLFTGNIWSIGGSVLQPLFRGGELTANRRAAIARFDQARADYRQTVIVAFQNVADTLRALETDADTLNADHAAAAATEARLRLIERQHALGAASYLALLEAQQAWTRARAAQVISLATRMQDTAALFQALGGGWMQRDPAQPMPQVQATAAP